MQRHRHHFVVSADGSRMICAIPRCQAAKARRRRQKRRSGRGEIRYGH